MSGYTTVQFHWGGLIGEPAVGDPWGLAHLAAPGGGPLLCGIDRHAKTMPDGTPVPGWSLGGGYDSPIPPCPTCAERRDPNLPIGGIHARSFAAVPA